MLDGVPVIFIQNQCRGHNAHLFRQFSCGKALECPVILQILAWCGAFFIGFVVKGQMNHDFALRIEVNPCVIEITIGKSKKHFVTSDNEYFLKNNFGRYKIIDKNKNVLYETSAKEFTVKLLFVVSVFIELLLICIFLKSNDVFKTAENKYKGR